MQAVIGYEPYRFEYDDAQPHKLLAAMGQGVKESGINLTVTTAPKITSTVHA
eukprot:COSAG01_NODE_62513_length_284_cov_0.832432_1_plen_51_part_10